MNGAMLRNLLDGLEAVGAPLERVVLYQGAKVYGVHLGPVPSPFYEDENPRHIGPNFYFTQEDELRARARPAVRTGPSCVPTWWSATRPAIAMNIATVIGAYAALCRADGAAFRFPGPPHVYEGVFAQVTDAACAQPGRASGRRRRRCRAGRGFQLRARAVPLAADLGEGGGGLRPAARAADAVRLATHMASKEPVWQRLVAEQGLDRARPTKGGGLGLRRFRVPSALRSRLRHGQDPPGRIRGKRRQRRGLDRRQAQQEAKILPSQGSFRTRRSGPQHAGSETFVRSRLQADAAALQRIRNVCSGHLVE